MAPLGDVYTQQIADVTMDEGTGACLIDGVDGMPVKDAHPLKPEHDGDASSEDEEDAPVENPSTDICGDLENALGGELSGTFKGSFSFCRTYPDAPNPGLNLLSDDIGSVGLPLNEREAKVVISGCKQAPFGQGERTVVDTSVRDTWEMDASFVQFMNPAWTSYIQRVLQDVCGALGVNMSVSQPRCELYKLLLYETGSHFLPHVDTEKVDTMFATIVIVLPSPFTGGAAHLSHGSLSETYDCSAISALQTTVLSWYTDVTHAIKPITSGYRLALSYNVYHTTNTLRPSLPDTHSAVENLRRVLLSWKQTNGPGAPRKIIYLLDHKYSQANLKGSALKGLDAHKLAILQALAKELDFRLGLANLERCLKGYAEDHGCSYGRRRHYFDEDSDEDDVDFAEVEEQWTTINNLVDLEGQMLEEEMDFDEEGECIPSDLAEAVEDGSHDDQDYEGYMGNGAGSLERWYRRTVLVIWPQKFNLEMTFDDDVKNAIEELGEVDSAKPRKRERKVVDFLLNFAKARSYQNQDRSDITQAVCTVACRWSNAPLFFQAVEVCGITGVEVLGNKDIHAAIDRFGFEPVKPTLEKMILSEKRNVHRFQFLDDLEASCSTMNEVLKEQVFGWVAEQRKWALEHLQAPLEDDKEEMLDRAYKHGGITLLRDTFVPQLKEIASPAFLTIFVMLIHSNKVKLATTDEEEKAALSQVITNLLSAAISKVNFYEPTKVDPDHRSYPGYGYRAQQLSSIADPQLAGTYIDVCLSTGNEALATAVIDRLIDMTGVSLVDVQKRAKTVLLPLLPLVGTKLKARAADAPAVPAMDKLFEVAIQLYLSSMSQVGPSKENIHALIQACVLHGGTRLLVNTIWPAVKGTPYQETTMVAFLQEIQDHRAEIPSSEGCRSIDSLIKDVLKLIIEKAPFSAKTITSGYPIYLARDASQNNRTKAIQLLKLCFSNKQPGLCSVVFTRLFDKTFINRNYIHDVLVPFIPELRQFLINHQTATHAEPFGAVFMTIVSLWAKQVLGPKPADTSSALLARLAQQKCTCHECGEAFSFLTRGEGRNQQLHRIGAPKRRHVEKELAAYATGAATWRMIGGSPQGLLITKTDAIYEPVRWKAVHAKSAVILQSISSDPVELQRTFGTSYAMIMAELQGHVASKAPRPPVAPAAAIASTSAAGARAPLAATAAPHPPPSVPAAQPSRKRKATYNPSDVIDLSGFSP